MYALFLFTILLLVVQIYVSIKTSSYYLRYLWSFIDSLTIVVNPYISTHMSTGETFCTLIGMHAALICMKYLLSPWLCRRIEQKLEYIEKIVADMESEKRTTKGAKP